VITAITSRLEVIAGAIKEFKADCVIDVILSACHTYNLESFQVGERVKKKHDLPFLKIETYYSDTDRASMRVRIETVMEMVRDRRS